MSDDDAKERLQGMKVEELQKEGDRTSQPWWPQAGPLIIVLPGSQPRQIFFAKGQR